MGPSDHDLSPNERFRSVVVICTKDRPHETTAACKAAHATSPRTPILVLDASTSDTTERICDDFRQKHASALLLHRRARNPGLARQRNEAISACRELGAEIIHFIDDDTQVLSGYFRAIEERFSRDPTIMGIGGIIINQPPIKFWTIKRWFLLVGRTPGSVCRSGRNTLGQYPGTAATDYPEWLSGCSMSYRIGAFDHVMFDGGLTGPSLGEDYDFSFRLSRSHRLAVEPGAVCLHHVSPVERASTRAATRQRTLNIYRWVRAHRSLGMSLSAFWWATLGDATIHTANWCLRKEASSLQHALAVVDAATHIVRDRQPA